MNPATNLEFLKANHNLQVKTKEKAPLNPATNLEFLKANHNNQMDILNKICVDSGYEFRIFESKSQHNNREAPPHGVVA